MRTKSVVAGIGVFLLGAALAAPGLAAPRLAPSLQQNQGTIIALNGSGADSPGDPIDISSQVRADSSIQVSNLYYELFAPGGARVDTHQTNLPPLSAGTTFSDGWSSANTPSTGTYTVTLCWSTGNAKNCNIAYAETTFYSVPTLGSVLTGAAALLLGGFLWRNRAVFERKPE